MLMWACAPLRDLVSGLLAGGQPLSHPAATSVADSGHGFPRRSVPQPADSGRLPRRGEGRRGYLAGRCRADGPHRQY